ncbi:hypothetical protein ABKV19_014909 [Rosa sericea]
MFGVTASDGSRRRLPQWMLGGSSTGQERKSSNVEEKGNQLEEGLASQEAETVTAKPGKGIRRREKETLGEGLHVLQKCEAKKRKRNSTEHDEDFEGNDLVAVLEKKCTGRGRRKVQESVAPDRQKAKAPGKGIHEKKTLGENSYILAKCETKRINSKTNEQDTDFDGNVPASFPEMIGRGRRKVQETAVLKRQEAKDSSCGNGEEREVQTSSDDDVELTAEDLVMIAEEYIKADRKLVPEKASNQECESGSRLALRVASSNKSDDSMDSQNCNTTSLIQDATSSKPNGSLTSEEIALNSSRTGDPAQDMLDLFLGPWLKKPVEKEARTDILTDNLAFSYKVESQTHSNVVKEEIAPITKKKTSLKDKVAMFLD